MCSRSALCSFEIVAKVSSLHFFLSHPFGCFLGRVFVFTGAYLSKIEDIIILLTVC